jgi:hypothetical protein
VALRQAPQRELQQLFKVFARSGLNGPLRFELHKRGQEQFIQDCQVPLLDHFLIEPADDRLIGFR